MGWNDRIDPVDLALRDFLEMRLNLGELDGPAKGIASLVLDRGEGVLSGKQRFIYEQEVLGTYANLSCRLCSSPIPLNEAICAKDDNGGNCASCANMLSRDD